MIKLKQLYHQFSTQEDAKIILVVNAGSSSLKISLFQLDKGNVHRLLDANLKNIHLKKQDLEIASYDKSAKETITGCETIKKAVKILLQKLTALKNIELSSIQAVGHRFVHGGPKYTSCVKLSKKILSDLEALTELAPLHNPPSLEGIKACRDVLGDATQEYVLFDTAFFSTLPAVSSNYAIPRKLTKKYAIRRYGFHGISHQFLWNTYNQFIKGKGENKRIITLHLGNGCSLSAIKGGDPLDTSMGFTPAEGLIMATRAGDIDAAIVEYLCKKEKTTPEDIMQILNFESGLLGVAGISDMQELIKKSEKDEMAKLAIDMFCYRAVKYLASYMAVLGGTDAIVFSGGIGENSSLIRSKIIEGLKWLGVKLDKKSNLKAGQLNPGEIRQIQTKDSTVELLVIGTDENLAIAKEVKNFI